MDVILMERVEHLGQMGDVVTVKDGYARNYLLPQRKALRATADNRERFERQRTELEARNLERRAEAESVGARMEGLRVVLIRQSSDTGQLYGSANARDIANGVTEAGFNIDRKQVLLDRGIKTLGVHPVRVALHPEVTVSVNVNVARSEAEAEQQEAALRPETSAAPTEDEAARDEAAVAAAEEFFEDASLAPAGDPGQDALAPDDPGPPAGDGGDPETGEPVNGPGGDEARDPSRSSPDDPHG